MSKPSAIDAVGIHQADAFFDARYAVWDLRERIPAEKFLLLVKRAMVGADSID